MNLKFKINGIEIEFNDDQLSLRDEGKDVCFYERKARNVKIFNGATIITGIIDVNEALNKVFDMYRGKFGGK